VTNPLRGRMPADAGIQVFAAAIALADVLPLSPRSEGPSARARIALAARRDPKLHDVFAPLLELDIRTADEVLAVADWLDPDERADVFEWVLSRRSRFVETRTSEDLIALFVSLLQSPRTVFDPAAGEGGLLAAIAAKQTSIRLFGQEINEAAWRTANQRFLLRGIDVDMQLGDSLLEDRFVDLRVDAVICDPPYSLKNPLLNLGSRSEAELAPWASFAASRARTADFVWLEHALGHLREDGLAYVVLPVGSLFRATRDRDVRVELLRKGVVDAVVALPGGSVQHTTVPLALWILRGSPIPDRPVLIVDAGMERDDRRGLSQAVIDRIRGIIHDWHSRGSVGADDADVAAAVPAVDLLAHDANLTPTRYISPLSASTAENRARDAEESIALFVAARNRLVQAARELPTLDQVVANQWVPVRELVTGEVAEVVRGVRVRPEDCLHEGMRVLRTRDIRDTISDEDPCFVLPENMKPQATLTQPGDVILSPASGKLRAIVDEQGGHILASPLQALRFRTDWLDPTIAAAFLESPRNRRFATGATSGYARVDLRDLELPLLPREDAHELRGIIDQLSTTERQARELAARAQDVRETILTSVGQPEGFMERAETSGL
jgi:type I restriction-modification system DNA methylase subunit